MAIEVTTVPYGEAAVAVLADRVATAKKGDPLAAVTVVVPSNYAAVATRRELARRGGVAATSFLTLYRLAERVGGPALARVGRRPVSAPVVLQAVRAVLAEAPGVLAEVASHPATELALAAAQRELAGVSADALDAVAARSPRARDVVRIVRTVTERLRGDWHDEHDLVLAATEVLQAGGVADLGPVILYLPEGAVGRVCPRRRSGRRRIGRPCRASLPGPDRRRRARGRRGFGRRPGAGRRPQMTSAGRLPRLPVSADALS